MAKAPGNLNPTGWMDLIWGKVEKFNQADLEDYFISDDLFHTAEAYGWNAEFLVNVMDSMAITRARKQGGLKELKALLPYCRAGYEAFLGKRETSSISSGAPIRAKKPKYIKSNSINSHLSHSKTVKKQDLDNSSVATSASWYDRTVMEYEDNSDNVTVNSATSIVFEKKDSQAEQTNQNPRELNDKIENTNNEDTKPTPVVKIKPINVRRNKNYRELLQLIAGPDNCHKFTATLNDQFIRIFPETEIDRDNIVQLTKDSQIEAYSYATDYVKPYKVVIKGLPVDFPIDEIHDKFFNTKFKVLKVAQLTSRRDHKPLPIFQLHLQFDAEAPNILKINRLSFFRIKIEKYKNPYKITQCHNCQLFNHNSVNCWMAPRCVKCGDTHHTKNCQIVEKSSKDIKCCNCGGPHPASYRGCSSFKAQIPKASASKAPPNLNTKSYAHIVKNSENPSFKNTQASRENSSHTERNLNSYQQQTNNKPAVSEFTEIIQAIQEIKLILNINNFTSFISTLKTVVNKLKNAASSADKILIIAEALTVFI